MIVYGGGSIIRSGLLQRIEDSLLANWRMAYAPKNPEASLHPCFVASLHYADRVQYLLDILLLGSLPEKQQLLNGKEVTALGKAINQCKKTEDAA